MFSVFLCPLSAPLVFLTPPGPLIVRYQPTLSAPLVNFATPLVPLWDDIRVKHTWNHVPPSWETLGHPLAGTTIDLHVALKPHDENALIDALYEVSTPRSPKHVLSHNPPHTIYRAHLSKEDVAKLVAPHPDTLKLVHSWLAHHGVQPSSISTTHGGGWLTITEVPVSRANELGASYQLYRRTGTNDTTILRTIGYALPVALRTHVQTVVPTMYFASAGTLADTAEALPPAVTPADLRWLYAYMPAATERNMIGIVGFGGDYPSTADLTTSSGTNGGKFNPNNSDEKPNQNILYAQAIAHPTPLTFYSVGGNNVYNANTKRKNHPPPTWFKDVFDLEDVPQTISISYGDSENNVPLEYASALCNLFAKLGARGASIIFPSDNEGVGEGDCKDSSEKVQFTPISLHLVAVRFLGGFSTFFPRPICQHNAVLTFLQHLGSQYDSLYNAAGRGIPDISAQAFKFSIGLYDVTSGSYPGCGTDGFSAVAGWDPVLSGLGTPRFSELQKTAGLVDTDPE
ncbi:subtilisin-like protein [Lactarius hengduanensis]|nr:subtilisin-like protein [Lactarius hengduanensis]